MKKLKYKRVLHKNLMFNSYQVLYETYNRILKKERSIPLECCSIHKNRRILNSQVYLKPEPLIILLEQQNSYLYYMTVYKTNFLDYAIKKIKGYPFEIPYLELIAFLDGEGFLKLNENSTLKLQIQFYERKTKKPINPLFDRQTIQELEEKILLL